MHRLRGCRRRRSALPLRRLRCLPVPPDPAPPCDVIAALYVETGGAYFGLPDVEPWDAARDARNYPGPWPVVAHPPCGRWSLMGLCRGYYDGDDGGCFEAALDAVRKFGGVLEHPAHTLAWRTF